MYRTEDFVCITVPKCASRSIMNWAKTYHEALMPHGMHGMSSDPADYEGRLVFATVRNPYSRALSLWKHVGILYKYDKSIETLMREFMGHEELTLKDIFRYSQIGHMKSHDFPFADVPITYVHMENFDEELRALPLKFYKPIHEGATPGNSWKEIDTLSPAAVSLVNEWAADDFEVLEYSQF